MSDQMRPHLFIQEHLPSPEPRIYESGGGGVYPRKDYKVHANKIYREAAELGAMFAKLSDTTSSEKVYFRVEFPEKLNMWSGKGEELEEKIHAQIVGSPAKNVGHVSANRKSFHLLLEQLERYSKSEESVGKSNFAQIERLSDIPTSEKLTTRLKRAIESKEFKNEALVSLFPDLTRQERENYKILIQGILQQEQGQVSGEYLSERGLFLKVKANSKTIEKIAGKILAVQSVDAIDELIAPSSTEGDPIESSVVVKVNSSSAAVCIFDTGAIQNSRFIDGSMLGHENPLGPTFDSDHGTFVASRIIYGDTLRDQIAKETLSPDVKVLSVCVFPHDGIGNKIRVSTEKLMETIRSTVERWYRQIRVFNLSLNLESPDPTVSPTIADDSVNPLAAELDNLAKKYDVLFVVSAGNFPARNASKPTEPYPNYFDSEETRICPPAEANLAITVGSFSDRENGGSMAKRGKPSPFTRRGPGFSGYRKPDLVAHGGNYAQNWRAMDDLSVAGISKTGDHIAFGNGTSFSAPLVSRLAAHLFATIPGATSPLVRAMLIHFANLPDGSGFDEGKLLMLMGNGLPAPEKLMHSNPWEQSFLYQGEADYRKIHQIPFFVPRGLTDRKGRGVVGIRATIAYNSETDRTLKSGYCKVHLRTKVCKINSKGQVVGVNTGDGPLNVNDMYSTVIRRDHTFMSGVQSGDWAITIEQITRWKLKDVKTRFGLVLTLLDPKKEPGIDIYSLIQSEVPNRYTAELQLPTQIRL